MKQNQANIIISNLHCWYKDNSGNVGVNDMIIKCGMSGYAIHPDIINKTTYKFISSRQFNPNSTFYKTWSDIESKDRFELLVDQITHYASTYGTDYEGTTWVPNDQPIQLSFQDYIVIQCLTPKEIGEKILSILQSGIALDSDVVDAYVTFIVEHKIKVDINTIKNYESACILSTKLGKLPDDSVMATRMVWYKVSGQSQIIQNYKFMKRSIKDDNLKYLSNDNLITLSKSFYRYKKMWLAIKSCTKNKHTTNRINRIRRYAKKYHQPLQIGFWDKFLTFENISDEELRKQVDKLDNPFKIIKLLEVCMLNKQRSRGRVYNIRNGKIWIDTEKVNRECLYIDKVAELLTERLVVGIALRLRKENPNGYTAIKLPKNVVLTVPSSAKSFCGNYPYGSYIPMKTSSFVGIYWENAWGTNDFDISYQGIYGMKIGWDGEYQDDGVIYSGDMTNAQNGASEILKFSKEVPNGVVTLNRYNGEDGSKYIMFAGSNSTDFKSNKNNMGSGKYFAVDPNDIELTAEDRSFKKEQLIGIIDDSKLYPINFDYRESVVSERMENIIQILTQKAKCHISLETLLRSVGYLIEEDTPFYHEHKCKVTKTIDLSNPTMDQIINLIQF